MPLITKRHDTPVLIVSHNGKQAFCSLQTNIRIVNTKMAAGTDHYLEVIKRLPLSSMSTAEQLLVNWQELFYETQCQLVTTERLVDIKAWPKNTESFQIICHD